MAKKIFTAAAAALAAFALAAQGLNGGSGRRLLNRPGRNLGGGAQGVLQNGGAQGAASARGQSAGDAAASGAVAASSAIDSEAEKDKASDLNLFQAPLEMVLETYAQLVDRTVLKDPNTPSATITIQSRPGQKLSKQEQIEAIENAMDAVNGVEGGGVGVPVGVETCGSDAVEVVDVAPGRGDVAGGGDSRQGRVDEEYHHAVVGVAEGTADACAEGDGEAAVHGAEVDVAVDGSIDNFGV
ncbi:MAG: hypothetical protein IIT98_02225 [Kiritimatiellae bacterium]|nr:hypothetical protein [Kiritimatiellia bacterium]